MKELFHQGALHLYLCKQSAARYALSVIQNRPHKQEKLLLPINAISSHRATQMLFYHTTKNQDKHFVKFRFAFKIGKCVQCTMHSSPFKFMETNMKSRLFDKQYPADVGNINNVAQEDGQILLESVCYLCAFVRASEGRTR